MVFSSCVTKLYNVRFRTSDRGPVSVGQSFSLAKARIPEKRGHARQSSGLSPGDLVYGTAKRDLECGQRVVEPRSEQESMTPERWEKIKELVDAGLEREDGARARFLDEACAGDSLLRSEVGELIASHEQAGSFMTAPAYDAATTLVAEDADLIGRRIGPYQAVRELGHGGMGAVYLAVRADEAYRKEVAVKVVKRGMDTEGIIRSFRTERQILASLDHPNIARLLDGGTTEDGRPYFVMDYVEGLPLDVYCDTHKMSIAGRLTLFRTVCSAVHYAHERGVIHRDLKPGNILVTPAGIPKLLDFGIAKVLNPELSSGTIGTTTTVRPLTPGYASPEQIRGDAITPESDVYSLGVLLFELLTGHRPYRVRGHTPQELERVICEQEPEKPSTIVSRSRIEEPRDGDDSRRSRITPASVSEARDDQPDALRHRLAGDIDNVVLMALRKEPGRRYASVEQLSEDLHRHLEGLPVRARKSTLRYRTTKLVARNRATAITAAISSIAILTLVDIAFFPHPLWTRPPALALGSARVVTAEELSRDPASAVGKTGMHRRSLAVLPFQPLVGTAPDESLEFGIADALISELSHLRQLTVRPAESVRKYAGPGQAPEVAADELGVDTLLVGRVDQAGDRIRLSVQLISPRDNRVLWTNTFDEQWAHIFAVETAIATQVARALTLPVTNDERQRLAKRDTDNPAAYREYLLGRHFWSQRTPAGLTTGLQHFARAIELDPNYALAHAGMADSYVAFASFRVSSANDAYLKARAGAVRALELDPTLSEALSALAMVNLYYEWNWMAAERAFKRALALNPDDGTTRMRYAMALPYFERFDDALREIARARETDPLSLVISSNVGKILHLARRYDEAIEEHRKALVLDPNFWGTHNNLGLTYVVTGAYGQAVVEFQRAIDLSENSEAKANLAYAYAVSGRPREAKKILHELETRSRQAYSSPFDIAAAYAGLGDRDRAFAWLERAYNERARPMPSLKINPLFDSLRADPRFAALTRRMRIFDVN
jgi:serine/threonine protein kinase/TolB-like protein/Flp pilus assembly protein TadD